MQVDCVLGVEESRTLSNLFQIRLSERSLDNDVDQVLADGVVLIFELSIKLDHTQRLLQNQDLVLGPLQTDLEHHIFFELLQHVDLLS
jgi:hypothetical protein